MTPMTFYLATPLLIAFSMALTWQTSPYDLVGASEYEKRRLRRLAGFIMLFVAALSLAVGLTLQVSLANP